MDPGLSWIAFEVSGAQLFECRVVLALQVDLLGHGFAFTDEHRLDQRIWQVA
jgi:hypothetical protein